MRIIGILVAIFAVILGVALLGTWVKEAMAGRSLEPLPNILASAQVAQLFVLACILWTLGNARKKD